LKKRNKQYTNINNKKHK